MEYLKKYDAWLNNDIFDEETKKELREIQYDPKEIEDRFYKDLSFGTGGLRGIIGAGTNRMNIYTVTKATQGLANYIISKNGQDKGVVIAYDSRIMSKEFSEATALCLNANGIKTYLFESLRPTPELSFSVRYLKCIAGIVITASHNPSKYNGYKVYWEDGAQITSPIDKEIISEVNKIEDYSQIKSIKKEKAIELGLYNVVGKEVDDEYISEIKKLVLNKEAIETQKENLKIVYTPLHGTGNLPVRRILSELGFKNVYVVKEQENPDGNFPTVTYPNPEDKNAFKLALDLAQEVQADIVLATDPDADRLGVYVKDNKENKYVSFTGNMMGVLISAYRIEQLKQKNKLNEKSTIVSTIVSTNMIKELVEEYNLKYFETLTGFKYIGEKIKEFEQGNSNEFVFGFEESYGSLIGTYARDKDAVSAVMALVETASYYKNIGMTLIDAMENLYKKYGYYKEDLVSLTLEGVDGSKKIEKMMNNFRNDTPTILGEIKVLALRDYKKGIRSDLINNTEEKLDLPSSNVLYFELENNSWCCVRPSGTEPKIKFYIGVKSNNETNAIKTINEVKNDLIENKSI